MSLSKGNENKETFSIEQDKASNLENAKAKNEKKEIPAQPSATSTKAIAAKDPKKEVESIESPYLSLSKIDRDRLSKGTIKNHDAQLKFLTKRLYERKGYYCELEVRLFEESYLEKYKKEEISDVDVLGVKYEPDLKRFMSGIECKSTSSNGLDELLKVRGLQELLDLDYVGLVKSNVSNNVRLVASKLDVQLHSEKELVTILESMTTDLEVVMKDEASKYVIKSNIEKELKTEMKGIIKFLNSSFWTNEGYQNINTIVRVLETLKGRELKYYQSKYILVRLTILLSITLLNIASQIIKSNYANLEHIALDMLFGGANQRREKQRAYDIISQELGKQLDPNPSFTNEYINLISWIVKDPNDARYLPQCINYYLECFIEGNSYDRISNVFTPTTVKLSKDIIKFCSKISGTDKEHQDFLKL